MGTEVVEQKKITLDFDDGGRIELEPKDGRVVIHHLPTNPMIPSEAFAVAASLVSAGRAALTGAGVRPKDLQHAEQLRTIEAFLTMVDNYIGLLAGFEQKRTLMAIGKAMEARLKELG